MKKILLIVLALTTVLGLVACTNTENTVNSDTVATDTGSIQLAPADVVLFGGDDDYRIVYSSNATSAVKDMVVQMSSDIKAVTGENPKRVGDNAKNESEKPKEILFAKTNRDASEKSMSKISGIGYRVEFIGEKLVITASNDSAMKLAVEKLLATWTAADGKIILNNTTVLTEDMSENMLPICENGELKFKVIIQASAASEIHTAAESLAGRLSVLTGKTVSVEYDGMVKETEGAYEICIGNTNRAASKALYDSLETTYSYEVSIEGTRIVAGSKHNEALVSAISNLADDLCSAISSAYCGSPSIAKDYSIKGSSSNALLNFPEPKVGVSRGISKIGDDEYVFFYESIQKSDFETYVSSLKSAGCTENATYTMGDNEYALMENDSFSVYVAYLAKASSMRVVLNKPNTLQPDPAAPTEANVCKPALWQLEVDNKGSESNGGMSYVIQLTDGTFIVIDGGYNTNTEADNLYKLLKDNTVGGGEPVISAWFITHLHSDHWGCLKNFSAKYGSTVTVKAFYIYNNATTHAYVYAIDEIASSTDSAEATVGSNNVIVASKDAAGEADAYITTEADVSVGYENGKITSATLNSLVITFAGAKVENDTHKAIADGSLYFGNAGECKFENWALTVDGETRYGSIVADVYEGHDTEDICNLIKAVVIDDIDLELSNDATAKYFTITFTNNFGTEAEFVIGARFTDTEIVCDISSVVGASHYGSFTEIIAQ